MAPPDRLPGPFESEAEVRAMPAVREVYRQFDADPGVGKMTPHIHRMLLDALAAAGVDLGAHDHAIAGWLANWEPQTVAVIASWITRAGEAGQADAASARLAALLDARRRDDPRPVTPAGDHPTSSPRQEREVMRSYGTAWDDQGGEPCEAAP
jgi:hypothetical protein